MISPVDGSGDTPDDGSTEHDFEVPETDIRESNASGAGPRGLEGDLGISSERTGPLGSNPHGEGPSGAGTTEGTGTLEGTGSVGSATRGTDGVQDTTPGSVPQEESDVPAEGEDHTLSTGVDRTVGEQNPDPVANKHEFDPSKNPRH